jgi:hypothetical protein
MKPTPQVQRVPKMDAKAEDRGSIEQKIVEKNIHAVALGKLGGMKGGPARALAMTKKEREECARKGGLARMKKLSKAERTEVGRKAVQARWNKAKSHDSSTPSDASRNPVDRA